MSKLVCMGELLIDFQSKGTGTLSDTEEFVKKAGGAPANVCVQAVKLGARGVYLTQVGADAFGEFLVDTLKAEGVNVDHIKRTPDYDTSLAFVSINKDGERQFSFYRRTAADLYYTADDFNDIEFEIGDVFEFGSVALKTESSRKAHDRLIQRAKNVSALICFDPNLRFNLWEDRNELKTIVWEYAKKADIVKLGDDELLFLTNDINADSAAVKFMRDTGVKLLALTRGSRGAKLYINDGRTFDFGGYKVKAVDATGAGDSFFGGLIAELMRLNASPDTVTDGFDYDGILTFACKCGSYTTTSYGAIAAMGTREKIIKAVK